MVEETENTKESVLLAWKALEYQDYSYDWKYYGVFALALLAVLGYSIYAQDWFVLAIAVILAGFMFWYQRKKPVERTYRLTQLGMYIDHRFYPYHDIYSYWLQLNTSYRSLNIIFAKKYIPQMTILFGETDPMKIRQVLSKYIPEEDSHTENMQDRLMRWFRL